MRERGRRPGRIKGFGCAPSPGRPNQHLPAHRKVRMRPIRSASSERSGSSPDSDSVRCRAGAERRIEMHLLPQHLRHGRKPASDAAQCPKRRTNWGTESKKKTLRPDLPGEAFSGPMFGPALDAAAAAVPPLPTWASGRPRNSETQGRTARHSRRTESWPPKTLWNISSSSTACIPSGFG